MSTSYSKLYKNEQCKLTYHDNVHRVTEKCILYLTSQYFPPLRKEDGKYAKNATLREIRKNSKNPFVAHETIFNLSKQFLMEIK